MLCLDLLNFDADIEIVHQSVESGPMSVDGISLAQDLGAQKLVFVKNSKFLKTLEEKLAKGSQPKASLIIEKKIFESLTSESKDFLQKNLGLIATTVNVPLSMTKISKPLFQEKFGDIQNAVDGRQMGNVEIHPSVIIGQGVFVGEHVKIGSGAVIHPGVTIASHVEIGDNSTVFANVAIYSFSKIGKNVRIHSNTTVGSDGFGYVFDKGIHHKIWHTGGVEIHDDVEIGSNCSIDMGAFTPTVIGSGTKIDNQVQVAHNTKIGKGCILCGQSGVAGSAVLEDYVVLGGRAAIGPDSHIGMASQVAGGAMVNEGAVWPAKSVLGGHPARDIKEWMRTFAWVRKNALKN
ncbi:MAG: UDP-3-O-(3-hydroxymyristoyl)glucosamine N-acyltransferase [Bacteriovoracaceae bacterium]|nr:UDP-3-O-(3-hydroxymyristoyl)glucosamine N-acyltransferase [Bacteriovoracaceae bacterium]